MERPLRLIAANPVEELARTIEALLVVASQPLTVDDLAEATDDERERVDAALELLCERYREGRSGIVLEHVAGGWAFRASREAAAACARLFERPVERGPLAGGARDARGRRLPRAVLPAGDRADPRRQRRRRRRRASSSAGWSPRRAATRTSARSATARRRSSSGSSGSSRSPRCRASTTSAPT